MLKYQENEGYAGSTEVKIHLTTQLDERARLAIVLIEKWGMIAGVDDGEDSSGRSKLRLMTEEEVIDRAVVTAGMFYDRAEELGWSTEVPAPKPQKPEDLKDLLEDARLRLERRRARRDRVEGKDND